MPTVRNRRRLLGAAAVGGVGIALMVPGAVVAPPSRAEQITSADLTAAFANPGPYTVSPYFSTSQGVPPGLQPFLAIPILNIFIGNGADGTAVKPNGGTAAVLSDGGDGSVAAVGGLSAPVNQVADSVFSGPGVIAGNGAADDPGEGGDGSDYVDDSDGSVDVPAADEVDEHAADADGSDVNDGAKGTDFTTGTAASIGAIDAPGRSSRGARPGSATFTPFSTSSTVDDDVVDVADGEGAPGTSGGARRASDNSVGSEPDTPADKGGVGTRGEPATRSE